MQVQGITQKDYIKSLFSAIPIRELEVYVNEGLNASMPLHHRLQIRFHYPQLKPWHNVQNKKQQ